MDSLTHLAAGVLTPLAFRRTPKRAAVVGFGIAVGALPDMDIFFVSGPEAFLTMHRGFTHALFWQPVLVLLVVIPFYLWMVWRDTSSGLFFAPVEYRKSTLPPQKTAPSSSHAKPGHYSFGLMYITALTGVSIHIYLDAMTTFGTMIFLPFSAMRVAFPAMFIIDPVLTLPLLVLLILVLRSASDIVPPTVSAGTGDATDGVASIAFFPARSQRLARVGLAWILFYPLLCLGVNAALVSRLAPDFTAPQNIPQTEQVLPEAVARLILRPEPISPFVWKVIFDEGPTYRVSTLFPLRHLGIPDPERELRFSKPDQQLYAALMQQHALFGRFRDFAPLMAQVERPAVQSDDPEPVREYVFMALRYVTPPRSPARWFGRTEPVFVLEVRVDSSDTLLAYRLLRRSRDAGRTPWVVIE